MEIGRKMRQNRAAIVRQTTAEGQSQKDKARDRHSGGTEAEGRRERAFGELRPMSWSAQEGLWCRRSSLQPRGRVAPAGRSLHPPDLS